MPRAAIYARFSSAKQDEASIDAQVRACREYAEAHGLTVVRVYADEAISGRGSKTQKRKEYNKMLRDVEDGKYDIILAHKYDRIARDLYEHATLDKRLSEHNCTLIATAQDFGSSNEALLMKAVSWVMSEIYSHNLADESRKGSRETALKGLHNGGYPPFGYDVVEQKYVINEIEAHYVRKMFNAARSGEGFADLIREMDAAGIRGKRGKPIKYPSIYEILRNEKYTGVYLYTVNANQSREDNRNKEGAIRIEGAIPKIIDRELFEEVKTIMEGRKHVGRKGNYLCGGLVYCGNCGAKMHATTTTNGTREYSRYYCSKRCGMPSIWVEKVDDAVMRYVDALKAESSVKAFQEAINKFIKIDEDFAKDFATIVAQKIEEKQGTIERLIQRMGIPGIPNETIVLMSQEVQKIRGEIEALKKATPPEQFSPAIVKQWFDEITESPTPLAVRLLVRKIIVNNFSKNTTEVKVLSTLPSVVGNIGSGGMLQA